MNKNKLPILFENQDFIILNKPAGMLVIPDRYDALKENLITLLKTKYPEVFVVHRIDMDTSGIICFALNAEAHKYLSELFQKREIDKRYWAISSSIPNPKEGTIDSPIGDSSTKGKVKIDPKGREAISHYKVIEQFNSISLMEIKIETGRTHQIRIHLKDIACPLLVDAKYGKSEAFYLSHLKGKKYNKKTEKERPLMSRHSLHARSISFIDMNGKTISAEAEIPKDFRAVLNQLRKFS